MEIEQVLQLVARLEESKLKKLHLKNGNFELQLEKADEIDRPIVKKVPLEHAIESAFASEPVKGPVRRVESDGKCVTSPMVGTFYSTPGPDLPPFVKVGDLVDENTVVCIIEAMKVMNEVKAGMKGKVVEFLADHAQPVEFGTKLLRIV